MPKKQKQKQKQSQKTSVVVNVGTGKKSRSRRPKSAPAPAARQPSSISVVLQGSSMNLPAAPTHDYNRMIQELDFMRRQQAASGSLIPNMARNDLLNRVQATNPFTVRSTNTQAEMLNPYEGQMEEVVEAETTPNAYTNNPVSSAEIPIDQDFIRQTRIARLGQNLGSFTDKIGVADDAETLSMLSAYDDEDLENRLAKSVSRKEKALASTSRLVSSIGMMTPERPSLRGKMKGYAQEEQDMSEYELKRMESIKKERQRQYNEKYREKQKAGK